MKELTKKQKNKALKDMIRELENRESAIKYLCVYFSQWYFKNIGKDFQTLDYMKTFPELLNAIERRLIRQKKKVYYSDSGKIVSIGALLPKKIDHYEYRINILRKIQKEII